MSTPTVHFEVTSTSDEDLYTNSQTILIINHASIASTPSPDDTLEASEIIRPKIDVTGEGQKTSSVLSRALSRIEMKIQAETIRLSDRSWKKRKSYCP